MSIESLERYRFLFKAMASFLVHPLFTFMFLFSVGVYKTQMHNHITNVYKHRCIRKLALHNQTVRRNFPATCAQREKAGLIMQTCYTNSLIFHIISTECPSLHVS